jgi:hypothetical protein
MFTGPKVTEIYCRTDVFCKKFTSEQEKYMVEDKHHHHRNKPNRMNDAEIYGYPDLVPFKQFYSKHKMEVMCQQRVYRTDFA